MRFSDLRIGEALTLKSETPAAWRVILRKVSDERAEDDRGVTIAIGGDEECDAIESASLSHALWFEHEGAWKLVLRWTTPRDTRAKWATIDPSSADEEGKVKALGSEQDPVEDRRARALLASAMHARGDTKQAISLVTNVAAALFPQTFGVPPPPQISPGVVHAPHITMPPHPSAMGPQFAPADEHI